VTIHRRSIDFLRATLLCGATATAFLAPGEGLTAAAQDGRFSEQSQSRLVELVREATRGFANPADAELAGYHPAFGCVSGPQEGAMGVHYINIDYVKDPTLDPTKPEALMYEFKNGRARLLGVEFIVDAATWLAANKGAPPALEGQAFHLVGSPNRYALDSFFELHVWAYRPNPGGMFVDWNVNVTCNGQ
jgi:hypothetical protein